MAWRGMAFNQARTLTPLHLHTPLVYRMQQFAKELEIVIPVSFFEEANNAYYNSVDNYFVMLLLFIILYSNIINATQ